MKFPALSRTGVALALSTVLASMATPVLAQMSGLPSLTISPSARDRVFMRLQYVHSFTKTTSGDAYDVTGPVIKVSDIKNIVDTMPQGATGPSATPEQRAQRRKFNAYSQAYDALNQNMINELGFADNAGYLGTPAGIKARAGDASTIALSIGYFLGDEQTWLIEALLLGAPLNLSVYGDGVNPSGNPNGVSGKKLITTKMLPPTVLLGRYFGAKDAAIRPYVGLGAMYAIFFDTKPTNFFSDYVGGETTVSTKNAFGVGPFVGLEAHLFGDWHASLNVGQVSLKSEATITTRNTMIKSDNPVLNDYSRGVINAIEVGKNFETDKTNFPNGFVTQLMTDVAANKGGSLGTYVRKQNNRFDNTIMMLSVGRSF